MDSVDIATCQEFGRQRGDVDTVHTPMVFTEGAKVTHSVAENMASDGYPWTSHVGRR